MVGEGGTLPFLILQVSVTPSSGFFFVHFSAGQFRPKACGALSFEGEKLSFRSKNTSFFHKGSFFCKFFSKEKPAVG